ncbi:MAG TPA: hypothetical protein VIV11_19285 [Kofleriaceae bacterium]
MRSLLFLALLGCQGKKEAPPPAPPAIQVRDASGVLVAELRPIRPCRGSIGPVDLIVGGPPLISNLGTTQWAGSAAQNGTTLYRDGEAMARVFPVGDANHAAVLDMRGVALARIQVTGAVATVSNQASVPVRNLRVQGALIKTDDPAYTITGTQDLVIAALLSAPELLPEVRVLAACERVLVKDS